METPRIRTVIGSILIVCGIIWLIMFPKTGEVLRPDFVISVALGLGLIGTGVLFLFLKKLKTLLLALFILLLWSVLLNVCFFAFVRYTTGVIKEIAHPASEAEAESPRR